MAARTTRENQEYAVVKLKIFYDCIHHAVNGTDTDNHGILTNTLSCPRDNRRGILLSSSIPNSISRQRNKWPYILIYPESYIHPFTSKINNVTLIWIYCFYGEYVPKSTTLVSVLIAGNLLYLVLFYNAVFVFPHTPRVVHRHPADF
jgi:hypothetical protein